MDIKKIKENLQEAEVIFLDSVDSTNRYAKENFSGSDGAVIADEQTKGRGRLSHRWESVKGKDLTFTIVCTRKMGIKDAFIMNFYTSLIIFDVLKKFGNVQLKWPNDILISGKKVGGILTETESKNGNIRFYIGIGINVNSTYFADEINDKATSLKKVTGSDIDIENLLTDILKDFFNGIEMVYDVKKVLTEWKKDFNMINKEVSFRVNDAQKAHHARVLDVMNDGSILLEMLNGEKLKFYSGEISFIY